MVKHFLILFVIYLFPGDLLSAQNIGEWNTYTSYSTINALTAGQENIIAASAGGIILQTDEGLNTFDVNDGLYQIGAVSLLYDKGRDLIVLGYSDGTLDVTSIDLQKIQRLNDISRTDQFESKSVNALSVYGDILYVGTDFGIVEYDINTLLVNNTFYKFGTFDYGIKVTDFYIRQDSIYVSTEQGVTSAYLQDELNNVTSWITYNEEDGLSTSLTEKIVPFSDSIYVINNQDLMVLNGSSWRNSKYDTNIDIIDISVSPDMGDFGILTEESVTHIDQEGTEVVYDVSSLNGINSVSVNQHAIYVGSELAGVHTIDKITSDVDQILPEGPQFNFLNKLMISDSLLVGTNTSEFPGFDPFNPYRGYSILNGNRWKNYNRLFQNELEFVETIYSLGQTSNDIFLGSWGDGVVQQSKANEELAVYNNTNSNLRGINSNEDFVVISGLDNDSYDNLWAVSYLSEKPLNVFKSDNQEWITFDNLSGSDNYYNLFIDSNDQKWISLITDANTGLGLLIVDTKDVEDPNDDEFIKLTENPDRGNLPHPKVNAIVEDRNGEVWIGTERGLARFIFPEFMINGTGNERQAQWLINEDTTAASRFLLRDLNVTALAVNSANQKWVGSRTQGLWLLNSEGSRILKRFTAENSSLISNNINDIEVNEKTGEVFISTEQGLVSYQDVPKLAENKMNTLKVYPNPFKYADHSQILIEGLNEETIIKILGVDGFVVNSLETRGGRVSWNGRDYNGNKLGSGVYFVVANSTDGDEKGIGKVVIVN